MEALAIIIVMTLFTPFGWVGMICLGIAISEIISACKN
jgi:hypothetical protein